MPKAVSFVIKIGSVDESGVEGRMVIDVGDLCVDKLVGCGDGVNAYGGWVPPKPDSAIVVVLHIGCVVPTGDEGVP